MSRYFGQTNCGNEVHSRNDDQMHYMQPKFSKSIFECKEIMPNEEKPWVIKDNTEGSFFKSTNRAYFEKLQAI